MADSVLVRAAGRIADGENVDWASISSSLTAVDQGVADELAVVARIAAGHRQLHQLLPVNADTPPNLMPDRARWGHLDLLNIVGRGSYGTVYRAWDTRLERLVALKLFHGAHDPEAVMQEGRMLARVRNENVVTVYGADVIDGVAGLWMELIHGQTLDAIVKGQGPMRPRDAAQVGVDIARGLAAIHAAGLLHCDIKAQNVVRETTGRVVLMDLGAGRVVPEARDSDQLSDIAGTPRYMAPELFHAGAEATRSTDVYSFGVLLYYLVSARFPVDGKSLGELKQAHLDGRVTPLKEARADVPAAYGALVLRALERSPARRWESASELQSALTPIAAPPPRVTPRSIGLWAAVVAVVGLLAFALLRPTLPTAAPSPLEIRSIAVLPIRNLTGDPSKAYIADGLTEVLISDLARFRSLRVRSSGAVAKYRDSNDGDGAIAKALGVQLLLAGSVAQADTKVRIVVRLVDQEGNAVWGEELTREPTALLSAQAEIARLVATHLALTVSPAENAGLARAQLPIKPDAADAYLRGLALRSSAPVGQDEAASLFRKVVEIEPTFAPAWGEMAYAEIYSYMREANPADRARRANGIRDVAHRTIELDPELGRGYLALGTIEFYQDWNFAAAERTFRSGLDADPADALLRQRLSMLLAAEGKLDDAIVLGRQAQEREPNEPIRSSSLGMLYYYARDFASAETEMKRALAIKPDFAAAHFMLAWVYSAAGRIDDALNEMSIALRTTRSAVWLAEYARELATANRPDDVAAVLVELAGLKGKGEEPYLDQAAYLAAAQGDHERALTILNDAVAQRSVDTLWLAVDARVDPLRADPRFDQLLSRMGLRH